MQKEMKTWSERGEMNVGWNVISAILGQMSAGLSSDKERVINLLPIAAAMVTERYRRGESEASDNAQKWMLPLHIHMVCVFRNCPRSTIVALKIPLCLLEKRIITRIWVVICNFQEHISIFPGTVFSYLSCQKPLLCRLHTMHLPNVNSSKATSFSHCTLFFFLDYLVRFERIFTSCTFSKQKEDT